MLRTLSPRQGLLCPGLAATLPAGPAPRPARPRTRRAVAQGVCLLRAPGRRTRATVSLGAPAPRPATPPSSTVPPCPLPPASSPLRPAPPTVSLQPTPPSSLDSRPGLSCSKCQTRAGVCRVGPRLPATPGQLRGVWGAEPLGCRGQVSCHGGRGSIVGGPELLAGSAGPGDRCRHWALAFGPGLDALLRGGRCCPAVVAQHPWPGDGPVTGCGGHSHPGVQCRAALRWATRTLWGDRLSGLLVKQDTGHGSGRMGPQESTRIHTGPRGSTRALPGRDPAPTGPSAS